MGKVIKLRKTGDVDFDAFVEALRPSFENFLKQETEVSPERLEQFVFAVSALKLATIESDVNINFGINITSGYVQLESDSIEIYNMKWFRRAAEFADNVEVYPLINNRVRMAFAFHNLVNPAKIKV